MRKNINKLATLVMTGALAASMSFGAFANTTGNDSGNVAGATQESVVGTGKTMTVHKKITTDGKTYAPNASFGFTVTPANVTEAETKEFAAKDSTGAAVTKTYDIKKGVTDSVEEVTKATFTPGTVASEYDVTFTVKFNESKFATAGVYKYTLSEEQGVYYVGDTKKEAVYPGMTYDAASYTMYVFVVNDGTTARKVSNIVIMNSDGAKVNALNNMFGDGTNTDEVYDLTISKVIDGNMGVTGDTFTFDVMVDSDVDGEKFKIVEVDANGTEKAITEKVNGEDVEVVLTDDASKSLTVTNGTKYRIYGLTKNDVVSVKEQEAGKNGYVTTYTTSAADQTSNAGKLADGTKAASVKVSADGATLTITNTRDAVTPTGVAMDIAPYALMVALAGGAAATFLRKKESFED